MTTVDKMATDTRGESVDPARCRLSVLPHDAHTRAEHAVYTALWNLASPAGAEDSYRDVRIGYDKLAALAGASQRTVHRLTKMLTAKLAIEAVAAEISALRQGKTWRIYGTPEILRRRREAGYLWTARDRSTVRLVKMTALETPTSLSADDQAPPAAAENPIAASALEKIKILIDDDQAAAKLCHQCRRADPEASDEEILHFLELSIDSRRRRAVVGGNWREEVIAAVPVYFTQRIPIERYRLEHPRRSERC
jgi:hypothetical protein